MYAAYSVTINADANTVFEHLVEPASVLKWLSGLNEYEIIQATDDQVGTTFRQVWADDNEHVVMTGVVTQYKQNVEYGIRMEGEGILVDVHYQLKEADGGTRLSLRTTVRYRGVMRVVDLIAKRFIRNSYLKEQAKNFESLAKLCEGTSS